MLCCTANPGVTCFPFLDEIESALTKLWSPSWQVLYSCCEGSPWGVKPTSFSFPPEGSGAQAHRDCCCPEIWRPLLCVHSVVICHCWFHTKLLLGRVLQSWISMSCTLSAVHDKFQLYKSQPNTNAELKKCPCLPSFQRACRGLLVAGCCTPLHSSLELLLPELWFKIQCLVSCCFYSHPWTLSSIGDLLCTRFVRCL